MSGQGQVFDTDPSYVSGIRTDRTRILTYVVTGGTRGLGAVSARRLRCLNQGKTNSSESVA